MRLLICAGGTGGGVYPALAVHNALISERTNVETLWIGGEAGMEADLVERAGISYRSIPAAGVHGVGLRTLPGNLAKLARGVSTSKRILNDFRPDVLFFTGGYLAVPMAVAGRRIPILLYVPDIEPGLALKVSARFADKIALTASDSMRYFKKNAVVTGYPLRSEISSWNRTKARSALGLTSDKPTLLVFGGSKGARSINNAVLSMLPELLDLAEVIHISGKLDWEMIEKAAARLSSVQKKRYHTFPYLHEMGKALAAADLVVSRAGASSLGEYPYFALPAVLVPYPHAWRYQKVNADFLAQHGAAVTLDDSQLKSELLTTVKDLLKNNGKRKSMQMAMRKVSKPDAARAIASHLLELAGEKSL
ncbi:MAG: undecaprenyldiphospho-muramoylpentapeptide beta-N-acetylglucosaminyltransferase [Anaerolineae bacterium]|nr:undecaprenyldiphospho-muramoylpentapeptide beta-N-acetylglucosaminyltransferase [Anaerolineae bacterium]